jgi:hypothetical protein
MTEQTKEIIKGIEYMYFNKNISLLESIKQAKELLSKQNYIQTLYSSMFEGWK